MMLQLNKHSLMYLMAVGFIFSWWTLAFSSLHHTDFKAAPQPVCEKAPCSPSSTYPLLPFVRAQWHQALMGDVGAMMQLLAEWQVEAHLLEAQGVIAHSQVSHARFLRAQELAHRLIARERGMDSPVPQYTWQTDDGGALLTLPAPPRRFLPQTELAAAILLTLCPLEQIVALPSRMRTLPLFPASKLACVPYDIDRYNSESLFALKPDVAFIAHYTTPTTVQALREQEIALFLITRLNSIEEILETICKIGHVVGQEEKAELLTLFVQAGLSALDNRLAAASNPLQHEHHPLYLEAFSTLSAPTKRSLSGQLAQRLQLNGVLEEEAGNGWSIPLSGERLHHLAPTWIVFSLRDPEKTLPFLRNHPILKETPAAFKNQIFAVDEAFQNSPTHFLLLAYYDLVALILPQLLHENVI